jgi:hypothetical protein
MERQSLYGKEHRVNNYFVQGSLSYSTTYSRGRIPHNQKAHTLAIPSQSSVHRAKGTHIISLNAH